MKIDQDYRDTLRVLSEGSVARRFDPYLDIDWDSPEFQIDPADPRWILPECDPLGAHPWYKAQSEKRRIEIGMWRVANIQKVGLQFESVLIRGMMQYAMRLPNGSPEFRYCLHEMTEECNHIQMFQELVNRTGLAVPGMRSDYRATSHFWHLGAYLPIVFFIGILAGEEPIDHFQKEVIRDGENRPPALLRTMEIHIAEEARHISFARHYLKHRVPGMPKPRRRALGVATPIVLGVMARIMLSPPGPMVRHFNIPKDVVREAYKNPVAQAEISNSVGKIRDLMAELGVITPVNKRIWKAFGIWDEPGERRPLPEEKPSRRTAKAA